MTDILMCFDKNYMWHAMSVACQIQDEVSSFNFITDSDSYKQVYDTVKKIESRLGIETNVYDVSSILDSNLKVKYGVSKWKAKLTASTYYRLYAPAFINKDRILYLDSDVNVYKSLKPLFDMTMTEELAAVQDSSSMWHSEDGEDKRQKSFNNGVLLMNLDSMRKTDFLDKILELAKSVDWNLEWEDQTLLNMYYGDDIDWLPLKWNWQRMNCYLKGEKMPEDTVIQHFVSKPKPWDNIEVEDNRYFDRFNVKEQVAREVLS